jgi:WD40 repeat protein
MTQGSIMRYLFPWNTSFVLLALSLMAAGCGRSANEATEGKAQDEEHTKASESRKLLNVDTEEQAKSVGVREKRRQAFALEETKTITALSRLPRKHVLPEAITAFKCDGDEGHPALALSGDGRLLAFAGRDKNIEVWDLRNAKKVSTLCGRKEWVTCLAFSPDGDTLVSGYRDEHLLGSQHLLFWDLRSGKNYKSLKSEYPFYSVTFTPDGTKVLFQDKLRTISLVDVRSFDIRRALTEVGTGDRFFLSPPGQLLVAEQSNEVAIYEMGTHKKIAEIKVPGLAEGIAFSPDGFTLAIGCGTVGKGELILWDLVKNEQLSTADFKHRVHSVAFSPDGKMIACSALDDASLRHADTGKLLRKIKQQHIYFRLFSPGGELVFADALVGEAGNARACFSTIQVFATNSLRAGQ